MADLSLTDSGLLVIGSRVSYVSLSKLRKCLYFKQLLYGSSLDNGYACMNTCSLDSLHCEFGGVRYKFKPHLGGFFTVFWVCPKLAALEKVT